MILLLEGLKLARSKGAQRGALLKGTLHRLFLGERGRSMALGGYITSFQRLELL